MLEEEMKAQANPSTQVMKSSLNPTLFDFSKLSIHKQGDDERRAEIREIHRDATREKGGTTY